MVLSLSVIFPNCLHSRASLRAPLPHPAAPVQHQPAPCSAVLRLAPGCSGEAAAALWVARKSRAHSGAAGGGGWAGAAGGAAPKDRLNFLSAAGRAGRMAAGWHGVGGRGRWKRPFDFPIPQVQGFFRIPVDQLLAAPIICDYPAANKDLRDYVLVAGDIGEAKGVEAYAHRLHLPVAIVDKRRYGDDESPRAVHLMGEVEGKTALIVDDEIASAGTVIEAARFLAEKQAAAIEAAAVHGILSGRAIERLVQSSIRSIVVTDSVPIAPAKRIDKLTVLSVAPLFAAGIKAIHDGDSVSALFR